MPDLHKFAFTPQSLNFGYVLESTISPSLQITVENTGYGMEGSFNIIPVDTRFTVSLVSTTGTVGHLVGDSNLNHWAGELQPGQVAVFSIAFVANTVLGSATSEWFIDVTGGKYNYTTTTTFTSYTVASAVTTWYVSPSSINFGTLKVGTSAGPTVVTIHNTGTGTLTIDSITLDASEFTLTGLPAFPFTITSGNTQTFSVTCSSTYRGINDYNPGITITPSVGGAQTVELIYTGFLITPAYNLSGATQAVMAGLSGVWSQYGKDVEFFCRLQPFSSTLAPEAAQSFSKMHDYGNPSETTYTNRFFIRTECYGAVTAELSSTTIISGEAITTTDTKTRSASTDATGIPTPMIFDLESNGEIHNLTLSIAPGGGIIVIDEYTPCYQPRGSVYESA
jgi:hypothetical protein